jgi:hypothetical protein
LKFLHVAEPRENFLVLVQVFMTLGHGVSFRRASAPT